MKKFLLLVTISLFSTGIFAQTDLIISEYVEGWSTNKAIEIYNPTDTDVDLSGYRLVRYSNGQNIPPAESQWIAELPSYSLPPYKTYVVALDKRDPLGEGQEAPIWEQLQQRADAFLCPDYSVSYALYFNGDDAVALEKSDGTIVDIFGRYGPPRVAEASLPGGSALRSWTDTDPFYTGQGLGLSADHTLIRKPGILQGVTGNPNVNAVNLLAEYDSMPANTFHYLGWHVSDVSPENATPEYPIYSYEFVVAEQAAENTDVGTPVAEDAELDELTYYINSGNFVYIGDVRLIPFKMDNLTGAITVNDPDALIIAERDSFYLGVSAHDGYSQTPDATVLVRVTNESFVAVTDITVTAQGGVTTIDQPGGTLQLEAAVTPGNASVQGVYWIVVNETGEATVDFNGLVTAVMDGTVTVQAIARDNSGVSDEIQLTLTNQPSSVFRQEFNNMVSVFPNPVYQKVVRLSSEKGLIHISITNLSGMLIKEWKFNGSPVTTTLQLDNVPAGIYLLEVEMKDNLRSIHKLVVE
jgi:hypothetical protein